MDYEQKIISKIEAHDAFNQTLEKKLTRVKVGAVIIVFLLFALFEFVIHPRGLVYFSMLFPLLGIVIASRYLRRQAVLSSAEIRQYLHDCKDDKEFARVFIPLLLNYDYLGDEEDEWLTDFIINRAKHERDKKERDIIQQAIHQSEN